MLDVQTGVTLLMQEIRTLATASETFSPAVRILHQSLGSRVMTRYMTFVKEHSGVAAKVCLLIVAIFVTIRGHVLGWLPAFKFF